MTTTDHLQEMADEFRQYGRAECSPVDRDQWDFWADVCEAAIKELSDAK